MLTFEETAPGFLLKGEGRPALLMEPVAGALDELEAEELELLMDAGRCESYVDSL